jgi:hypothetical protein
MQFAETSALLLVLLSTFTVSFRADRESLDLQFIQTKHSILATSIFRQQSILHKHGLNLILRGGSAGNEDVVNTSSATNEEQRISTNLSSVSSSPAGVAPKNRSIEVKQEGLARFLYSKGTVFYNNVQVVNRDLSVLMLRYFGELRQSEFLASELAAAEKAANRQNTSNLTTVSPNTTSNVGQPADGSGSDRFCSSNTLHAETPPTDKAIPVGNGSSDSVRKLGGLHILDALSATGLRALRYTLEVWSRVHFVTE